MYLTKLFRVGDHARTRSGTLARCVDVKPVSKYSANHQATVHDWTYEFLHEQDGVPFRLDHGRDGCVYNPLVLHSHDLLTKGEVL